MGAIKNGIITGVQSTFSTTHIGLTYAQIICELTEAHLVKRMTGQDPGEIRFERKIRTAATIKTHEDLVNQIKDEYDLRHGTQQDVVVETALHNS